MKYSEILNFFNLNSLKGFKSTNEDEFKSQLLDGFYVYLIKWNEDEIYSWGTMSKKSNRIRKSSLFNRKLTGKYDRRVDYLMLNRIYGFENLWLFEFPSQEQSRHFESVVKNIKNQKFCYSELLGSNREEISRNIYNQFIQTEWFSNFNRHIQCSFEEFFEDVYLKKLRHPKNPSRTFFYGDCLEPKFLNTINKDYLESSVELVLDVVF